MFFRWRPDRLFVVITLFLLGMLSIELALQWRSHLRWGQSIFDAAAKGETRYVRDPRTGFLFLRPNAVFSSQSQEIRSNSLGLRSPELLKQKPANGIRIAVLGASSVFGAYAADNERTFSYLLANKLQTTYPRKTIEVVNAGLVGLSLQQQLTMLSQVVLPLTPDWIVLYTGTNDFVSYCRKETKSDSIRSRSPLWHPNLTSRLLTTELITKNTIGIRKRFAPLLGEIDPEAVDLGEFERTLRAFVASARQNGTKVLLATNARGYRRDQPVPEQEAIAGTALYYNYCFSLAGLHKMHERINEVIVATAQDSRVDVVRVDALLPGGARYFVDANHFSEQGERRVADILFDQIAPELNPADGAGTTDTPPGS